jgi:aryl-alcohol dehydrogenase-like predicted oxidoreductase
MISPRAGHDQGRIAMRRVTLGTTGIETSCLGFGCASLGSRVSEGPGLRALAAAHDAGVTWFDLAPLYGAGRAEEIAGRFLKSRPRDSVQLCSKVGLAPGVRPNGLKAALMPFARAAIGAVPALRGILRRGGAQPAEALPLTRAVLIGTIEESLRRLGTDYLDLYALHDVSPDALTEEVARTIEDILAAGKARAVAVASNEAAALAAIRRGVPFGTVQAAITAPGEPGALLPAAKAAGFGVVLHSVFGIDGSLAALKARAAADPAFRAAVTGGTGDLDGALARCLLERALAQNPDGVVLVSMFSATSRARNLAIAEAPLPEDADLLDQLALSRGR